ncbi:hypothetical protein ANME2D_03419 [Candidatus Methanoperedens nitroreducens]|uniref:Uncharacterized protein n=1 Tax=Candidatus Methanoperedens nitratireducens TaxID=1392998 RepID=A0A062V0Y6_9EURY|nr:hypothetical protein ANME2D_03419 [Candidatus Methanoperedens nitroreducens]
MKEARDLKPHPIDCIPKNYMIIIMLKIIIYMDKYIFM